MSSSFLSSELVLSVFGVLFLFFFFVSSWTRRSGHAWKLPPGPAGWPIVGNLFQVSLSGKPFIHYVRDLIPLYGPIFTLRMGSRTLIIVSDAALAHEALIEKGQLFASRPTETPTRAVFSCNKFTVNSAVYGPQWRSLRRNMVSGMLSPSRLREFSLLRRAAMDRLVARLRAEAAASGGAVWVLRNARFAVFCILLAMCFGLDLSEKEIVEVDRVMKRVLIVLAPRVDDFLPALSPLFARQRGEARRARRTQIATLAPLIDRRRRVLEARRAGGAAGRDPAALPFSYLDTLLDLKVEGRASPPTDSELVTLCSEFINGGTDTTATAVEWGMARLIENPSMQSRLQAEIAAQCGDRKVEDGDVERMPFLQALVKEILRRHPPTYFSLTHAAAAPAKLGGYDVPPGTNVEFFLPAMSDDPRSWRDPLAFNPERFLSGGEDADLTGVAGVKMIPFGAGRRICPGLAMGTAHIALILARMVQEFAWAALPGHPVVNLHEKVEFTVVMSRTLRAIVRHRE
ncbi:cytochrome P450 77A1-like [Wolffia australiana]